MGFDIRKFFFRKPNIALEGQEGKDNASVPEKTAIKCDKCKAIILSADLDANQKVCPKCGYHFKMSARQRLVSVADDGQFEELFGDVVGGNTLDFPDYDEKLVKARAASGESEGVVCAAMNLGGVRVAAFAMDAAFMMGSMGGAVGERITLLFEYATQHGLPVIGFVLSGGARMQEGIISLMQMAKTSGAVLRHSQRGLLYIAVLTDPTTGGVSASFAFEADIIIAEPKALIGFAGPRVIEQTIRQKLPANFQTAEFLLEKGFLDRIVDRRVMKDELARLVNLHVHPAPKQAQQVEKTQQTEKSGKGKQAQLKEDAEVSA